MDTEKRYFYRLRNETLEQSFSAYDISLGTSGHSVEEVLDSIRQDRKEGIIGRSVKPKIYCIEIQEIKDPANQQQ